MRKRTVIISPLQYSECGIRFSIPRKANRLRETGHVKDVWCYRCKRVTKFIETGEYYGTHKIV